MIDVLDLMNKGRTHLPFNYSFLAILARAYPGEKIVFRAHASHLEALAEMGPLPEGVSVSPVPDDAFFERRKGGVIENYGAVDYLCRTSLARNVVLMGARDWFLYRLIRIDELLSRVSFDIVFHATLAEPAHWRSRNPFVRRKDLFGILAGRIPSGVRFIVLERAIADSLRGVVRKDTKISVLEHPAQKVISQYSRGETASGKLRVAFIGATTPAKGFSTFLECAKKYRGRFEFLCVGAATESYSKGDDDLFVVPPSDEKLGIIEYERLLLGADLVCLPLDSVHYSWSASGTLLDCVRYGIPLITVRTKVVEDLSVRFGDFGYFLNSCQEIPDFLGSLSRLQVRRDSPRFRYALDRIADTRSIQTLAEDFRLNHA